LIRFAASKAKKGEKKPTANHTGSIDINDNCIRGFTVFMTAIRYLKSL